MQRKIQPGKLLPQLLQHGGGDAAVQQVYPAGRAGIIQINRGQHDPQLGQIILVQADKQIDRVFHFTVKLLLRRVWACLPAKSRGTGGTQAGGAFPAVRYCNFILADLAAALNSQIAAPV